LLTMGRLRVIGLRGEGMTKLKDGGYRMAEVGNDPW